MKKRLHGLVTPFTQVNKNTLTIMLGLQIFALMLYWTFGKFQFFPTPMQVGHAFKVLLTEQGLIAELWVSLWLCVKSMFFATIISAVISYLSVIPATKYVSAFVTKGRFLTLVGLSFFFTLMTSSGDGLKVSLLVFSITVFFTTSFSSAIANIEEYEYNHARTLGLNPWETLFEVVIYGKLADLLEVMKQNFAIAWMFLTMVEGIVRSDGGIGVLLLNQNKYLKLDYVFAIQIMIFVIGIFLDILITWIKEIICPYSSLSGIRK